MRVQSCCTNNEFKYSNESVFINIGLKYFTNGYEDKLQLVIKSRMVVILSCRLPFSKLQTIIWNRFDWL